ncbi:MAG: MerR family DNA-binding protein [Anaerolineae bacterium]|nr:MerR family DNA-binding protein [Anaerolineae bacterium]
MSAITGILRETIRYYEQIGLMPQPKRSENGYRLYANDDVERLQFIRRARQLDFRLDEVTEILAVRDHNQPPCQYVLQVVQERIIKIETCIHELEQLRDELVALYAAGKVLPEDTQMKSCVCNVIRIGLDEKGTLDEPATH